MAARLGALLAIVLWGFSFVATKVALGEVSPITLIFTRFAIGSTLLLTILAVRGQPVVPPRGTWRDLLVLGFVGVFVHQLLQANGLTLTTAVHTGWLIGLTPIWSALLAAILLRERFGVMKVAGFALGFLGAALVVTRGRLEAGLLSVPTTRGDLLILASTFNWAVYTILAHAVLRRLGPARATTGAMVLGWILLAPLFFLDGGWREYPALSSTGWAAVLFLGIGCSGLGYLLWYAALAKLEASRVAALLYIEPLVTLAAAVVLLQEEIGVSTVVGGVLVLLGVFLVQRAPVRRDAASALSEERS